MSWVQILDKVVWTQFLPDSGRIDTAVWMHYLDTN